MAIELAAKVVIDATITTATADPAPNNHKPTQANPAKENAYRYQSRRPDQSMRSATVTHPANPATLDTAPYLRDVCTGNRKTVAYSVGTQVANPFSRRKAMNHTAHDVNVRER